MKRILAVVLTLVILLSCLPVGAQAVVSDNYYYTDDYFTKDASVYQPSLATMTLYLNMVSFGYTSGEKVLTNIGFTHVEGNDDLLQAATMDSMGAIAAYRNTDNYTILAVAMPGTRSGEWTSNFTIGSSGEHQGFAEGCAIVQSFLEEYVAKHGSDFKPTLKLWITGYSRGAAVGNLLAAHITDAGTIGSKTVTQENIYAYTFETPKCTSTDVVSAEDARTKYSNIHNIVNQNDLVTYVAPSAFGFLRYGIDEEIIPSERTEQNNALFEKMLEYYEEAAYGKYDSDGSLLTDASGKKVHILETFQAKALKSAGSLSRLSALSAQTGSTQINAENFSLDDYLVDTDKTLSAFLNDFFTLLSKAIGSRQNYVNDLQSALRIIISNLFDNSYQSNRLPLAQAYFEKKCTDNAALLLSLALSGKKTLLYQTLDGYLEETFDEAALTRRDYQNASRILYKLIPYLIRLISAYAPQNNCEDIFSLLENADMLVYGHYPNLCFAWLAAEDTNYNKDAATLWTNCLDGVSVTDVTVKVNRNSLCKSFSFLNRLKNQYTIEIQPTSKVSVSKIEYSTTGFYYMKTGASFTFPMKPSTLYIRITDANGIFTDWVYKNGKVTRAA